MLRGDVTVSMLVFRLKGHRFKFHRFSSHAATLHKLVHSHVTKLYNLVLAAVNALWLQRLAHAWWKITQPTAKFMTMAMTTGKIKILQKDFGMLNTC